MRAGSLFEGSSLCKRPGVRLTSCTVGTGAQNDGGRAEAHAHHSILLYTMSSRTKLPVSDLPAEASGSRSIRPRNWLVTCRFHERLQHHKFPKIANFCMCVQVGGLTLPFLLAVAIVGVHLRRRSPVASWSPCTRVEPAKPHRGNLKMSAILNRSGPGSAPEEPFGVCSGRTGRLTGIETEKYGIRSFHLIVRLVFSTRSIWLTASGFILYRRFVTSL
jgi:hypothetical protein